jgi:CheY-like chemotaxis protein
MGERGETAESTILLVEDNRDHAELIQRAFEEHGMEGHIEHLLDGEAALRYLFQRGEYAERPRPRLILLDLRLPRVDGFEVLHAIKQSPELQRIPAVILTTSDADRDVAKAYSEHANSYLVKPVDFSEFDALMRDVGRYWLAGNRQLEA